MKKDASVEGADDSFRARNKPVIGLNNCKANMLTNSSTISNYGHNHGSNTTSLNRSTSSGSNESDEGSVDSAWSSFYNGLNKPHKAHDKGLHAIQSVRTNHGDLGLNHFRIVTKLGCGDIGSVYLAELQGSNYHFAMKVMDKAILSSRKKLSRAQTEKEILQSLDHPFLPFLYAHFDTEKFMCLVMEFCSGGDLHVHRQRQPGERFPEAAARFYAAEVLVSLEYLHMMGIIYRDLKPENVLVRKDGHIMLSDFDLSLRCAVRPTLVKSASVGIYSQKRVMPAYFVEAACSESACETPVCKVPSSCVQPLNLFSKMFKSSKKKFKARKPVSNQRNELPELLAEPTAARSLSFVGTHEYLAPEIIKGEGHGSAVDWWTLGIFLYELLYGRTPFKGSGNRATLFNIVGEPLTFPEKPAVSIAAQDLIRGLLVKDPEERLASKRGATEIKQHPFFEGVNWALIRSSTPPEVPKPFEVPTNRRQDKIAWQLEAKESRHSRSYLDVALF
ncbi:hypothetical protein KP509_23G019100 [Ceratopteris richardii]|uniref:non-specific serine/threonine protein kinase n=1 Tax=Ceratopteris richardii TaxID=49495 RepID=A0A8T2S0N7_CERRI|nr:hypothetical protein KP509_23G019100 [Ceratopteris richardii]